MQSKLKLKVKKIKEREKIMGIDVFMMSDIEMK